MKSDATGIKRILKAFRYSFDGFVSAFRSDVAFCLVMGVVTFFLPVQRTELVLVLLAFVCWAVSWVIIVLPILIR